MRILIVTDAWAPQMNGVVRTLEAMQHELMAMGHQVLVLSPDQHPSMPCPTYPEIRLAFARQRTIGQRIDAFAPDAIHLSTEGPLCLAARRYCIAHGLRFTTAYHTQFPDYVERRTGIPARAIWRYIRWFHAPSSRVLASTPSIRDELASHGIAHVAHWGRGVDQQIFYARASADDVSPATPSRATASQGVPDDLPRPILLYVGRIAVEKNIQAFLTADAPGTKIVVGDGPQRAALARAYPDARFLGRRSGAALAEIYRAADVLVFPSRTDTFGLVIIEALACGTPVAAYPVTGPRDIITPTVGAMRDNLSDAITAALLCDRGAVAAYGARFSWACSAQEFASALVPVVPAMRACDEQERTLP